MTLRFWVAGGVDGDAGGGLELESAVGLDDGAEDALAVVSGKGDPARDGQHIEKPSAVGFVEDP